MTPEQNLIQQIIRVLENNQLANNPLLEDYAAQYAELCTQVNSRLQRCAEYLSKGLLTEAVYEARTAPDLLELVRLVQFELAKKWRNVCADLELLQAPLLHTEIIESLSRACAQEQELEPLLKEFRSLIYQGLHRPAVAVLRKIRALDPDNSSWITNLRTFEEEELPEWLHRAETALHTMDLPVLREVSAELNHPCRVVPAPPELLQRLRKALLTEQAETFQAEAGNLVQRLDEALDQGQGENVQALLDRASTMEQQEAFFLRPDGWEAQLQKARTWQEKFQAEQQQQQAYQQQLTAMQDMLVQGNCPEIELRHAWERLLEWQRPVPNLLRQQVEELFAARHQRRLAQGRRVMQIISLTVLLLLLLGLAGGGWFWQRGRQQAILADLERDFQNADYVSLESKLEALHNHHPGFSRDMRLQAIRQKLSAALSEQAEHALMVKKYLSDLEEIRVQNYDRSDAQIEALLAAAGELRLSSQEKSQFENWRSRWQAWKSSRQREHNQAAERVIQQISSARASQRNAPFADLAAEEASIQTLRGLLQDLEPRLAAVSEENRLALNNSRTLLDEWQRDLEQRRTESAQQQQAQKDREAQNAKITAEIYQSVPDLTLYQSKLLALQELSGGEIPQRFRLALEHFQSQSRALALQDFSLRQFPGTPEQEKILRALLAEDGPARGSVWEGDLQRCLQYLANGKKARTAVQSLFLEQEEMHLVYFLDYKKKSETEWRRLYLPQMLSSRVDIDRNGKESTLYWGSVYFAETTDDVPELMHSSKAFAPKGLTTADYDLRMARKFQDSLCPQGKFLANLILSVKDQAELEVFILQNLQLLQTEARDLELVPRTWLQKRLLNILSDCFPQDVPESQAWSARINALPTDVPWMNPAHPRVTAAEAEIRRAGRLYPDLQPVIARLQAGRQLLANALSRRLACVGVLRPDEQGRLQMTRNVPGQGELWVLTSRSAHTPPVWYILSPDGRTAQPEVLVNCYDGQLLFSPRADSLPQVKLPAGDSALLRPIAWPVNARIESD